MKKTFTLFALSLLIASITFAQKTFNEQTFKDLLNRHLTTQSYDNFSQIAAPDFTLIGTNGDAFGLKGIEGLYKASTKNSWDFSDIKTRQYGSTGIATFKVKHSHQMASGLATYDELGTMTFVESNGKWTLVLWQSLNAPTNKASDEAAIKAVIDAEKLASDNFDLKTFRSHWSDSEQVSFNINGLLYVGSNFWKATEEHFAKPNVSKFKNERTNWNIIVDGHSAFVVFQQKSENQDSHKIGETIEERYMTKNNGTWKIVNMTSVPKP